MEQDLLSRVIEVVKIMQDPNIEQYVKEKTFKELCKKIIDLSPRYGMQTKQALKDIVTVAKNEKQLYDAITAYQITHDIRF